jgi:dipeptidyl aminopeptidase/acylaminoacyl peptidase
MEALAAIDHAIELDPQNMAAFEKRGAINLLMGRLEEATSDFNTVLESDEDNVIAQKGLGLSQAMFEESEEALTSCNRAVELNTTDAEIYNIRGALRAAFGDRAGAISDVQKALELGLPADVAVEVEQRLHDWQQAESLVVEEMDSYIAYSSTRNGNTDIYIIKPDGSGLTRLTEDALEDVFPAWSPDGQKIVYGNSKVRNHLWIMDPDGGNKEQITFGEADGAFPAWSPDGSQIAFDYSEGDQWDVYLLAPDSGELTNISNNEATHDIFPSWAPDGSKIVFSSNRDGYDQIYMMNADGFGTGKDDQSTV